MDGFLVFRSSTRTERTDARYATSTKNCRKEKGKWSWLVAWNGEYRVSRPRFKRTGVYSASPCTKTRARRRARLSFVRGPRGYDTVSACFAVWDQDPKVRLDRHRHKNSGGQRGQQRGPVFPGPPLSCDMLLVRYDSGVSIPAFCSVSDNARDAFVPAPRGPPFFFSSPSSVAPP